MKKEPRNLNGRVVAITGGARGIGRATAAALLREGCKVAIGDVDRELAEKTASELGGGTIALTLDVTDRASFEAFAAAVQEQLGPIDVLVNNAGIMPAGPFLEESDATALRQTDINVHGTLFGMKIVLPGMVARGSGHIVNLASAAGKAGVPGVATYCGTKHFVVGLTEAVRAELDGSGIDFSYVMPALVNTELTAGAKDTRGVKKQEPEDVADAIVEALQSGRVEVYVPKMLGPLNRTMMLMPRRMREGLGKVLAADKTLTEIDWTTRKAYEDRITHSEPSRDPEAAPPATAKAATAERPPVEQAAAQVEAAATANADAAEASEPAKA